MNRTLNLTDSLYQYLLAYGVKETPVMRELRELTQQLPTAMMQIAPEQGQLLHFLAKLIQAKNILEIGTFTGYSALALASALPEDGKLITCDQSAEWTDIAQQFWHKAAMQDKIELRLAPALETLPQLLNERQCFDLIFIDADKVNYIAYYDYAMPLLRHGGLLLIDNVFQSGLVAEEADQVSRPRSAAVRTVHQLNERLMQTENIDLSIVPIGDGLTMVRKW